MVQDEEDEEVPIECPTLVLCGREDVITPVEVHQEMVDLIPDGKLEVIEESGHLSTLEQPERVSEVLKTWLCDKVGAAR